MTITGILSAIVIGAIIGVLGRLLARGRQRIGVLGTILVGIVAALVGTFLAYLIGVKDTPGVDWSELALQIGLAVIFGSAVSGSRRRRALL